MTYENFCYWLQGYFEISGKSELNESQIKVIKEHLNLVFSVKSSPRLPRLDPQFTINPLIKTCVSC